MKVQQQILDFRNKILLGENLSILKQIESDTFDLANMKKGSVACINILIS
ncbi:MAG: hypothetical protein ACKPKT_21385 [Dolichospermum sp.]